MSDTLRRGCLVSFLLLFAVIVATLSAFGQNSLADKVAKAPFSQLKVKPASLSFAKVNLQKGPTSSDRSLLVTNSGTEALAVTVGSPATSAFSVIAGAGPATLNATQSETVTVEFAPAAAGSFSDEIAISSGATKGKAELTVKLKGSAKGTASSSPTPSPASTPFTALPATMTTARAGHTATLLPNGKVLLTGGCNESPCPSALNTAELYDPVAQTFTVLSATMTAARAFHTATLLPNGQVLITGGYSGFTGSVSTALDTAEVYDPVAGTFTTLSATMTAARAFHTATLLPNGQVLLTGGEPNDSTGIAFNTAELYDPVAQTFTALSATMTAARLAHTATLLPNGQVLLTGGGNSTNSSYTTFNTAEVYDPVAGTFAALTATMTTAREGHAATLLPNGLVLLTGGGQGSSISAAFATALNTAEVYDPVAQTFTALAATMTTARVSHTATLLSNGQVLLTGGGHGTTPILLNTAEVYEALSPLANTFTALTASMTSARAGHTATLLPNGQVLITGGDNRFSATGTTYNTAELYDPAGNIFTALAATMTIPREGHTATLLPNGQVLITGGFCEPEPQCGGIGDLNTAEVYDPVAQTFTALAATMVTARAKHKATLLPNGQVLLTGGGNGPPDSFTVFNTAELYDPVAQTFTALTATMTIARAIHTGTLLPDGLVLLTGGPMALPPALPSTAQKCTVLKKTMSISCIVICSNILRTNAL
jgi:N-acetylneuraminic acid mutarotase